MATIRQMHTRIAEAHSSEGECIPAAHIWIAITLGRCFRLDAQSDVVVADAGRKGTHKGSTPSDPEDPGGLRRSQSFTAARSEVRSEP